MPKVRTGWKNEEISKHGFYAVYHIALLYPKMKQRQAQLETGTVKSPSGFGLNVQKSRRLDGLEATAIKAAEYSTLTALIEQTAAEAGGDIREWLLLGVTHEGMTYQQLLSVYGIPAGRDMYYKCRRRFYLLLADKLKSKVCGA